MEPESVTNWREVTAKLRAQFPAHAVSCRIGARTKDKKKAIPLWYIDARDAMSRLDDVVGPENWQRRYPWSDGKRLCCEVGIRVGGEWIWKSDGAGETQVEAEKGAFSDAFKRACVNWGIGQYLYDVPDAWVELDDSGCNFKNLDQLKQRFAAWQQAYFQKRASK